MVRGLFHRRSNLPHLKAVDFWLYFLSFMRRFRIEKAGQIQYNEEKQKECERL